MFLIHHIKYCPLMVNKVYCCKKKQNLVKLKDSVAKRKQLGNLHELNMEDIYEKPY